MKSFGARPQGARLERMKASPRWAGESFRNVHPILPGLRDSNVPMPTLTEFLCGGERRVPRRPLPSMNPLEAWRRKPGSSLRATWQHTGSEVLHDGEGVASYQPSPIRTARVQACTRMDLWINCS